MGQGFATTTFRSRGSRLLGALVLVLVVLGSVNVGLSASRAVAVPVVLVLGLLAILVLLVFWRSRLDVTEAGVRVVNPLRTRSIPWESIRSVENRFVLVIVTDDGPVSVWAVPRPSAGGDVADIRRDPYGLPDYQAQTQHVRQDATGSTASAAQRVIEQHLRARDPGR